MRSALLFAALTLAACTAKPTPTGDQLIPADATLLVGADVAGLLSSELFGLYKPIVLKEVDKLGLLDIARDCGLDPITSRLTVVVGTDGREDASAVFTGDGFGDPAKIRCVNDRLAEKFVIHDRAAGPPATGVLPVAMVVDKRTVVLVTPRWAVPVHDLTLGKGKTAMEGLSRAMFDRAERSAHLWFAGKVPDEIAADSKNMGAEPKEVYAAFDLSAGFALRAYLGFGGPERVAPVKKSVEESAPMLKSFGPMIGLGPRTIESLKLEMKGDEVHFEVAVPMDEALELSKKFAPMMAASEPAPDPTPRNENPPPS